jgi:hypothetical protein
LKVCIKRFSVKRVIVSEKASGVSLQASGGYRLGVSLFFVIKINT